MSEPSEASPNFGLTPAEMEYNLVRLRMEISSEYVGRMIWLITAIADLISVIVVVSVVIIAILGTSKVPDVLSNWGGIILGFYFGQFVNLVKDFMGIVSGGSLSPSSSRNVNEQKPAVAQPSH